jgi:tetratricopeptide (TPR) repeat protein
MIRAAFLVAMLVSAVAAAAQTESKPQPAQTPAAAPATTGRAPVQTKTKEEYQAYQAAIQNTQNSEAMERSADDFAAKFPTSDVRVLLYRAAMGAYQTAGNSGKMMDVGLKVLKIDKDDPQALIVVSEVLEERTSPTDLDREQRSAQALAYAQHALETIDSDLAVPAGTPTERVEAFKKYLRSTALAIVGTVQYKQEHYPEAEATLKKAIEADAGNPDPVVILRLALTLDQEKKFAEALEEANRAVELTREDSDLGKMARSERDRLVIQKQNNQPSSPVPTPPAPTNPTPPSP